MTTSTKETYGSLCSRLHAHLGLHRNLASLEMARSEDLMHILTIIQNEPSETHDSASYRFNSPLNLASASITSSLEPLESQLVIPSKPET